TVCKLVTLRTPTEACIPFLFNLRSALHPRCRPTERYVSHLFPFPCGLYTSQQGGTPPPRKKRPTVSESRGLRSSFVCHSYRHTLPQALCLPLLRKHRGSIPTLPILELARICPFTCSSGWTGLPRTATSRFPSPMCR